MRDGDPIIIGGLIQTQESETVNKIPLLGDIPLLGNLFRYKATNKEQTEFVGLSSLPTCSGEYASRRLAPPSRKRRRPLLSLSSRTFPDREAGCRGKRRQNPERTRLKNKTAPATRGPYHARVMGCLAIGSKSSERFFHETRGRDYTDDKKGYKGGKTGIGGFYFMPSLVWAAIPGPGGGPRYFHHEEGLDHLPLELEEPFAKRRVRGKQAGSGPLGLARRFPAGGFPGCGLYRKPLQRPLLFKDHFAGAERRLACPESPGVNPIPTYRFSGWILARNVGPEGRIGANFSLIAPGFYYSPTSPGTPSGSIRRSTSARTPGRGK